MGDRCTGHCCREFTLPFSDQEIEDYAAGRNLPPDESSDSGFMARNAVFVGKSRYGGKYFTCKQYDAETGDCRAYESRPRVCKQYPNYKSGWVCGNKGCGWTENRATGKHLLLLNTEDCLYTTSREDAGRVWSHGYVRRHWTRIGIRYRSTHATVEENK